MKDEDGRLLRRSRCGIGFPMNQPASGCVEISRGPLFAEFGAGANAVEPAAYFERLNSRARGRRSDKWPSHGRPIAAEDHLLCSIGPSIHGC